MSTVSVNTAAHTATHVATNMLRGLKQVIAGCALDVVNIARDWAVLERGVATWLASHHLRRLVLEVWEKTNPGQLVGRFDFTIDYDYYVDGEGDLWLDPDTVGWAIRKRGSFPSGCDYRIVADNSPGRENVDGWSNTSFGLTQGLRRYAVGTTIGGGSMGVGLAYWN